MNKKKVFLIIQSALCIVVTVLLAVCAVRLYREGAARRIVDPLSWIYTRESAASAICSVVPLAGIGAILTFYGLKKGIRDENAEKPVKNKKKRENQMIRRDVFSGDLMKIRIALFALAVLMIILGGYNGSARDVFGKAVKICTECVGLG